MSALNKPKTSSAGRTRAWRARLRAQGLKPITIWTFDENDPAFQARLAESLRRWGRTEDDRRVQQEIDAFSDEALEREPDYDWGPGGPPV